jgi:isocitrate lyase
MPSANSGDPQWWDGIIKPHSQKDVERLRGSVRIEYTLAKNGAERPRALLKSEPQVMALGALTGNQAVQQSNFIDDQTLIPHRRSLRQIFEQKIAKFTKDVLLIRATESYSVGSSLRAL